MTSHLKGVFDVDNIALMMKAKNNISAIFFSSPESSKIRKKK